ncbi:hypothetical protein AB9F39_39155, partial [Rhizobium leguminosarum]
NFIASKVDAIIVNPVDTDATTAISKLAADAGIPLVYDDRIDLGGDEILDLALMLGNVVLCVFDLQRHTAECICIIGH